MHYNAFAFAQPHTHTRERVERLVEQKPETNSNRSHIKIILKPTECTSNCFSFSKAVHEWHRKKAYRLSRKMLVDNVCSMASLSLSVNRRAVCTCLQNILCAARQQLCEHKRYSVNAISHNVKYVYLFASVASRLVRDRTTTESHRTKHENHWLNVLTFSFLNEKCTLQSSIDQC